MNMKENGSNDLPSTTSSSSNLQKGRQQRNNKKKNIPLNKTDGVLFQERSEGSILNSQNDFVLFPTTAKSNRGSSLFALIDEENSIFQQRDVNGCLSILGESKYVFFKQKNLKNQLSNIFLSFFFSFFSFFFSSLS